jgi:hypothetical protein
MKISNIMLMDSNFLRGAFLIANIRNSEVMTNKIFLVNLIIKNCQIINNDFFVLGNSNNRNLEFQNDN